MLDVSVLQVATVFPVEADVGAVAAARTGV
jgi:hypothetical protein